DPEKIRIAGNDRPQVRGCDRVVIESVSTTNHHASLLERIPGEAEPWRNVFLVRRNRPDVFAAQVAIDHARPDIELACPGREIRLPNPASITEGHNAVRDSA